MNFNSELFAMSQKLVILSSFFLMNVAVVFFPDVFFVRSPVSSESQTTGCVDKVR